jgi:cation diffusion facilitator CzcD-associated flavoprotein CzcO
MRTSYLGATTITLIPSLAEKASKVTMVQRSPSYIVSMPNRSRKSPWYAKFFPKWLAQRLVRFLYLLFPIVLRYVKDTQWMKNRLLDGVRKELPPTIPFDPHFKPTYAAWSQRVCICPDGDFFESLRGGKAGVATGVIKDVTESKIILDSGETVECDIIVTATVGYVFSTHGVFTAFLTQSRDSILPTEVVQKSPLMAKISFGARSFSGEAS